jgi:dipeptidyl aminopeptidase/acylaminoacyl peptidase
VTAFRVAPIRALRCMILGLLTCLQSPATAGPEAETAESGPIDGPSDSVSIDLSDLRLRATFFPSTNERDPAPAVVLLHGWGFPDTTPSATWTGYVTAFRTAGYASLVPTLRGWPPTGGRDDCGDRQVTDILKALDWLGARPDVDAQRIYLVGYSQGAQIALLTAARTDRVRAVAAFAPVTDVGSWGAQTNVRGIKDYVREECGGPPGWPRRSPLLQADSLWAPTLRVHGDADRRVPTSQTLVLHRRLIELQRPVRMELIPGVDHAMDDVVDPGLAIDFFRDVATSWTAQPPGE